MYDELNFDDLLGSSRLRFVATGDTHLHVMKLVSWGWYWDEKQRVWANDNECREGELCIKKIKDLPGVFVVCEGKIELEND